MISISPAHSDVRFAYFASLLASRADNFGSLVRAAQIAAKKGDMKRGETSKGETKKGEGKRGEAKKERSSPELTATTTTGRRPRNTSVGSSLDLQVQPSWEGSVTESFRRRRNSAESAMGLKAPLTAPVLTDGSGGSFSKKGDIKKVQEAVSALQRDVDELRQTQRGDTLAIREQLSIIVKALGKDDEVSGGLTSSATSSDALGLQALSA